MKVFMSHAGASDDNPFVLQLEAAFPPTVEVKLFSWRHALIGRYDVFHLHWPEHLTSSGTRSSRHLKRLLSLLLLVRLHFKQSCVIIRTIHNVRPHEPMHTVDRFISSRLDEITSGWVHLTPTTTFRDGRPEVVIPHGHYKDWLDGWPRSCAHPGRAIFFGMMRPYKGLEDLIAAFSRALGRDVRLEITGHVQDDALAARLRSAARSDDRIEINAGYQSDQELVKSISSASVVVLPYRSMVNSGALLYALSVGRPVLAPRTPANELLAEEVGHPWVRLFDPPLSVHALEDALTAAVVPPSSQPDLSGRDWSELGVAHADFYAYIHQRGRNK